jgi:hypothetical protein
MTWPFLTTTAPTGTSPIAAAASAWVKAKRMAALSFMAGYSLKQKVKAPPGSPCPINYSHSIFNKKVFFIGDRGEKALLKNTDTVFDTVNGLGVFCMEEIVGA